MRAAVRLVDRLSLHSVRSLLNEPSDGADGSEQATGARRRKELRLLTQVCLVPCLGLEPSRHHGRSSHQLTIGSGLAHAAFGQGFRFRIRPRTQECSAPV